MLEEKVHGHKSISSPNEPNFTENGSHGIYYDGEAKKQFCFLNFGNFLTHVGWEISTYCLQI